MKLILVWTQDVAGSIGPDEQGRLNIPENTARLLELIKSAPVILGRKYWESLEKHNLTNEQIIVLSRNLAIKATSRVDFAPSFNEALALVAPYEPSCCFVLGGESTFISAMSHADELLVTTIPNELSLATHRAPRISRNEWLLLSESPELTSSAGQSFKYQHFRRKTNQEGA